MGANLVSKSDLESFEGGEKGVSGWPRSEMTDSSLKKLSRAGVEREASYSARTL